jgi:hypothetical protein
MRAVARSAAQEQGASMNAVLRFLKWVGIAVVMLFLIAALANSEIYQLLMQYWWIILIGFAGIALVQLEERVRNIDNRLGNLESEQAMHRKEER